MYCACADDLRHAAPALVQLGFPRGAQPSAIRAVLLSGVWGKPHLERSRARNCKIRDGVPQAVRGIPARMLLDSAHHRQFIGRGLGRSPILNSSAAGTACGALRSSTMLDNAGKQQFGGAGTRLRRRWRFAAIRPDAYKKSKIAEAKPWGLVCAGRARFAMDGAELGFWTMQA